MASHNTDPWGDTEPVRALQDIDRDPAIIRRLQAIFSEAGHVYKCHAEGVWSITDGDKERFATQLAGILKTHTGLTGRLLKLDNRLIKMITYRALELMK
ncbi:MAG: hypothetical protein ABL893_11540 [Hyphomicrobium sp.]